MERNIELERKIESVLLRWKSSRNRLPLLVQGARQVGKTHSLLTFGKKQYRNLAYFNFESNPELHALFETSLSPKKLLSQLSILSGNEIFEEETLIFFDEIQNCERALTSLKYFAEDAPAYHIAAAGSLLGVALNRSKYSFPVGKVQIEQVFPMDFEEFLWASGKKDAASAIHDCFHDRHACTLHPHLLDLFQVYIALGGMPRAVKEYLNSGDWDFITSIQKDILIGYTADMSKYADAAETVKIMAAYNSIPSQLAKPNRKFQYSIIKTGARASVYESPVEWLTASGLIIKVQKCLNPQLPVKASAIPDYFKIYLNDTGLLCSKFGLNNEVIAFEPFQISGIKGVLAENYVATALQVNGFEPYYWDSDGKAEVDFIIQDKNGRVIPVEVKSSENVRSKSLNEYIKKYKPEKVFRVSTKNFGSENNLVSVPLYAMFCVTP